MANTLSAVLPKLLARVMKATRPAMSILPLVNKDWSNELAQKGDIINVPLSVPMTATDVSPSTAAAPTPTDVTPTTVPITLDQHRHIAFSLTDKELTQIDADQNFIPGQAEEALIGIFTDMTNTVFGLYKKVYNYSGTAGTTPFASTSDLINEVSRKMTQFNTPNRERRFVLDPFATEKAKNLASFQDMDKAGSSIKIDGLLGRKLGFDFYEDQNVPFHTTGAAGTFLLDDTVARAVGIKTLHMDGATTKPSVGDIFTIAGDTQTYTVTASTTLVGTDTDVSFEPGLVVAIPAADGNEAVTFKASHRVNLAFVKPAFALAIRAMGVPGGFTGGNIIDQQVDPETGMVARAEIMRANKLTVWDFDVLFGVGAPRPAFACRLAG